jgi:uncharacterized protein (TIGR02145 family)
MFLSSSSVAFVSSSSAPVLSSSLSRVGDGVFTDIRDGEEYYFVSIGTQVWMAENLRYLPQVDDNDDGSEDVADAKYYYVRDYTPVGSIEAEQIANAKADSNYQIYGVLYNWHAGMNGAASSNANPSGIQGVCPDGWHLPSDEEWTTLVDYIDIENDGSHNYNEGTSLKAAYGWIGITGTDDYGFSALPGGSRKYGGYFYDTYNGIWWSTSEYSDTQVRTRTLRYGYTDLYRSSNDKNNAYSIRCVRD